MPPARAWLARAATVAAAAAAVLVATAAPASAHTIGGVQATNYRTQITGVTPPVPGVTIRIRDLGRRVELVNHTAGDVVILGYQDEPYLRVGPAGVFENRRSPSLYQNKVTTGTATVTSLPPQADPSAPPQWHRTSGGRTVSWRDHRVRWEGADPPGVQSNPGLTQIVVPRWSFTLLHGTDRVTVTGAISWVPGPAAAPWLLPMLALFALIFAAGATRWWPALLSGALAVLLAGDVVRLYGAATQGGGSVVAGLLKAFLFGLLEVLAWVGGVWAIGAVQERRAVGLYAAMAVGVVIGFVSGVGDLLNLAYSQVPTALPVAAARAAVVVCIGVGFGLVGGSFLALRRLGAEGSAARAAAPGAGRMTVTAPFDRPAGPNVGNGR
jgi:hypothetical protein